MDSLVDDRVNILGFSIFNQSHAFFQEFAQSLNQSWQENCDHVPFTGPAVSTHQGPSLVPLLWTSRWGARPLESRRLQSQPHTKRRVGVLGGGRKRRGWPGVSCRQRAGGRVSGESCVDARALVWWRLRVSCGWSPDAAVAENCLSFGSTDPAVGRDSWLMCSLTSQMRKLKP